MRLPKYIRTLLTDKKYISTKHFVERTKERDLKNIDIVKAILEGEVIERLFFYNVGEKFVVYCEVEEKIFHVALLCKNDKLAIKTVYIPNSKYYLDDNKTRKNGRLD